MTLDDRLVDHGRHVDSFVGPGGEEAVNFINLIIAAVRCSIHVLGWRRRRVRG
jgi:hypothetical protein